MNEPRIVESVIDQEEEEEEVETLDMGQDYVFIDSPVWSDEDSDFDPYVTSLSNPIVPYTPNNTDDEDLVR